jgi:hypothetical protein
MTRTQRGILKIVAGLIGMGLAAAGFFFSAKLFVSGVKDVTRPAFGDCGYGEMEDADGECCRVRALDAETGRCPVARE